LSSEAMRILWIVVMYIAAYPVTLSIRTSRIRRPKKMTPVKQVTPSGAVGNAVQWVTGEKLSGQFDLGDLSGNVKLVNSRNAQPTADAKNSSPMHRRSLNRTQSLTMPIRHKGKLEPDEDPNDKAVYTTKKPRRTTNFTNQVKNIVLRDVSWLIIAWFTISVIEDDRVSFPGDVNFTESKVLFEIISAFGNVGLSLGYPNTVTSFVGVWRTGSKLVLIVVMLVGRHRGLPDSIDRAITGTHVGVT